MKQQRGFTLAEMIVALAVSALLVSLTYGALRIGIRSWDASQENVDRMDTLRVGWQAVHASLNEAVIRFDPFGEEEGIMFKGEADQLTFTANMPSHLGLGGVYIIELYRDETHAETPFVLRRTLWAEHLQQELENKPQQAQLAEAVEKLIFRYFGTIDEEERPAWHENWNGQSTLPSLIRLDVLLEDGNRWPTLVAHPRISPVPDLRDDERIPPAPEEDA